MTSKQKFFSWSKGRQSTEPYHRTGGLLSIDTSVGDTAKETYRGDNAQNTFPRAGRRRPPLLNLAIPPEHHQHGDCLSPTSARHNAALVNSASNLLAVVNDMLRSPGLSATVCPRSPGIHKPLPSRPRSVSMPPTPDLPVELPGSLLLDNQGFPSPPVAGPATNSASTMRSARSGTFPGSSATPVKPSPSRLPQHKKSLSEVSLQRRTKSRPNLITSPSSTDSKLTACSASTNGGHASSNDSTKALVGVEKALQPSPLIIEGKPTRNSGGGRSNQEELGASSTPTPTTARSRQIDELKSTITFQDNTISTLQAQFGSLRASHEAHVASLIDAHTAELASLKNYTRVLEEQQSQRTLHHASSNHLLLFLDPNEPQSPTRESPQTPAGNTSATSIRSFKTALEQPIRSPHPALPSPDMENLKRKLSVARRPETGNRELIRELNKYKQNNVALQKQIESLMAKLNQSKKNERGLAATLEEIEKRCTEWQEKASKAEQLEKSTLALQNTIDHLEHRLEMANVEKLDAEEQIWNLQTGRSPFDPTPPKLRVPEITTFANNRQSVRESMSTIFSAGSPTDHAAEVQDSSTLAAFISHIERLQEQVKQKEEMISQLEKENKHLRHGYENLEREHNESSLRLDIQGQLLNKSKESEAHIEQLRSAIIEREAVIGEKEKALRMAERQLEHHKLLLHAEIRRHSTLSLFANAQDDSLPDLASLASKEDIDRWISRLQTRLKKEKSVSTEQEPYDDPAALIKDLRQEIDFYVREIIYYKLDIKGYKSDIKKMKHIATRMGTYGSRASDIESPTPSQCRSTDTPTRIRLSSGTPGLGISNTSSPVSIGPMSASISIRRPVTPAPAGLPTPDPSPADTIKPTLGTEKGQGYATTPMTPRTPPRSGANVANEADSVEPGISPRSVARLSPERRKPTPPSPDQERFGDLATNFPLSTPAAPKRHDTQRSMSDSIIQLYTAPRTPEWTPASHPCRTPPSSKRNAVMYRQRSASNPDNAKGKSTPERPPRPQYGLYETSPAQENAIGLRTPPRKDVMAEALRNSPEQTHDSKDPPNTELQRPTLSGLRGLSNSNISRTNSIGSASAIPAPLTLRSRAGSNASSTTTSAPPASSPPPRKISSASSSNIPFIIGMPSPHNPALISPTTSLPPTTCSITGKSTTTVPSSKVNRTGVGGTMSSTTPLTSPVEPSEKANYFHSALPSAIAKPGTSTTASSSKALSGSAGHTRNASLSMAMPSRRDTTAQSAGGGHSRSVSGSSIRNAIQLPSSLNLMKGKGRARKEDISHPTPLASPFDIDRGNSGRGAGVGIGRAI